MISQNPKPPATERSFATAWGELDYLCRKIHFWLYTRAQKRQASYYAARLAEVLKQLPRNNVAIVREDGQALLHELQGDLAQAIKHRRREIELMQQLHQEAAAGRYDVATRTYMLQGRDQSALSVRQEILAALEAQHSVSRPSVLGKSPSLTT